MAEETDSSVDDDKQIATPSIKESNNQGSANHHETSHQDISLTEDIDNQASPFMEHQHPPAAMDQQNEAPTAADRESYNKQPSLTSPHEEKIQQDESHVKSLPQEEQRSTTKDVPGTDNEQSRALPSTEQTDGHSHQEAVSNYDGKDDQVKPQEPESTPSSLETVVIQVPKDQIYFPKDQIYKVPSPKNATHAEKVCNPDRPKQPRCSFCRCFLFSSVAVVFLIGIIAGMTSISLRQDESQYGISNKNVVKSLQFYQRRNAACGAEYSDKNRANRRRDAHHQEYSRHKKFPRSKRMP